jgi:hypothetical protein
MKVNTGSDPKQLLFLLGRVVMTRGISNLVESGALQHTQLQMLLNRHQRGDWGALPEEDKTLNDLSITQEARIISSYELNNICVWIITEADRSVTTILMPSEY